MNLHETECYIKGKAEGYRKAKEEDADLLEACKVALLALESPEAQHVVVWTWQIEGLKAAIAKAGGAS